MESLQSLLIRFAAYGEGAYGANEFGREPEAGVIDSLLPKTGTEIMLTGLFLLASLSCLFYVYFRRKQLQIFKQNQY